MHEVSNRHIRKMSLKQNYAFIKSFIFFLVSIDRVLYELLSLCTCSFHIPYWSTGYRLATASLCILNAWLNDFKGGLVLPLFPCSI